MPMRQTCPLGRDAWEAVTKPACLNCTVLRMRIALGTSFQTRCQNNANTLTSRAQSRLPTRTMLQSVSVLGVPDLLEKISGETRKATSGFWGKYPDDAQHIFPSLLP